MIYTDCISYLWMQAWRWSNNTETCCHNKTLIFTHCCVLTVILKHFVLLLELKLNGMFSIKIVFGLVVQWRTEIVWGQAICGLSSGVQKDLACVGQRRIDIVWGQAICRLSSGVQKDLVYVGQRRIEIVWGQAICGLSSGVQKDLVCVGQRRLKIAKWYSDCSEACRQPLGGSVSGIYKLYEVRRCVDFPVGADSFSVCW